MAGPDKTESILKRKPWVHLSNIDGFTELKEKLSLVEHLNNSDFIVGKVYESDMKKLQKDTFLIKMFCCKHDVQIPVNIKTHIKFETILNHYESDTLLEAGVGYINSKTYFSKYNEQRIRNAGTDKIKDNFRYSLLRAFNCASANFFPFGVKSDGLLDKIEAYDRSNLMEFCTINLHTQFNKNYSNISKLTDIGYDKLSKKDLWLVCDEIKQKYPKHYPVRIDELLEEIKDDSASSTYTIIDCIGNDGVGNIVNKWESVHILIAPHEIISGELESINNKNNSWVDINYFFQNISYRTEISFTDEAKLSLLNDDYNETRKYFKYLIDTAPEYSLVPVMALDVLSKSDFKQSNDNRTDNFTNLAYLMEGKAGSCMDALRKYIEVDEKGNATLKELPKFKYELINACFTDSSLEIWNGYKKKLQQLKKVLKKLKGRSLNSQTDELKTLTPSKIDKLVNPKFSYNTYAILSLLFAGDGKTIKNSDDNVEKAIDLFLETFFGDKVFVVDELKNTYTIKDSEFLKLLRDTDSDGYSSTHKGRGEYFTSSKLDDYKKSYENYEDYQGTNEERVDKHIEELKRITNLTKFGWWEDTESGKTVYCGYDGNKKYNVSWEHIQNPIQTYGAIRANQTNSGAGAKTKVFDTEVGYYEYILKQQSAPKVKRKYKTDRERVMAELQLEGIIEHFKKIGK